MTEVGTGWTGRTLAGRYAIVRRIGSGGFSTVYEALDTQLGRKVAVKLFSAGEARDDGRRRGEVDVLARLNHPNLVTMYDAHLAGGDSAIPSFLVMELIDGLDLRSALDNARGAARLTGDLVAQITSDIAEGLSAMHAIGIVHRDLKPANILLAPTGLPSPTHRAKLADFGIAYLVGADRMTTIGTVIGTAAYLSPEQASGAKPGPATDVYALGLVILECLTGRREYPGTIVESLSARAFRDPVVGEGIPASWITLLTQMTARDPDARPSALDVAVRARGVAADLAGWQLVTAAGTAAGAGTINAATAAMPTPTVRMPSELLPRASSTASDTRANTMSNTAATQRLSGAAELLTQDPPTPQGRRRAPLVAAAVLVLLGGVIWAGTSLAGSNASSVSDPAQTGVSVPTATPTPTPETTAQTATATNSPTPAEQTAAPVDSTTPADGGTSGNNGNGNGTNGNGKDKGKGKG
ncbi:serine/threonine-protein kinase [Subtercola frigoramans]|uniref:non-specific serine/threonine protein kinase n=1 Tax=Subtercola frigoramans TaxID=120298 RepID=A0ABS2L875_9MICO|nr:serine/threonine-protein kinase [Subtercola frigoramans]MBM7473091.1 serine/threonine protein kinase [Subtercola frigoramans]